MSDRGGGGGHGGNGFPGGARTTPPPFVPPAPAVEWETHYTEEGDAYYYNPQTGETSWDPPEPVARAQRPSRADEINRLSIAMNGAL